MDVGGARAHLSEANARTHVRSIYFVHPIYVYLPIPAARCGNKKLSGHFFKSFRASLACLDRADTFGSEERTRSIVHVAFSPTLAVCFRTRILSQRSNSDVSNGHISIYALLQLSEKEAAGFLSNDTWLTE